MDNRIHMGTGAAPGPTFPVLQLSGSHFEIGLGHGRQAGPAIRAFLADRLARMEPLLGCRFDLAALRAEARQYAAVIEQWLPCMAQEVAGLAEGAGIALEDAYLLQLRRELVGYQKIPQAGDCSTVGVHSGGQATLAQTVDLNGGMSAELTVLDITLPDGRRRVGMVSFTGLLGYLGMNSSGLSICLNLVLSGDWGPGIPGYLLIRHLLDSAATVDQCIAIIESLPRASSRALTICDGTQLACIEYTPTTVLVTRSQRLAHTNHFLDPRFGDRDELNLFARGSSMRRLQHCTGWLERLDGASEAQAYFDALAEAPAMIADNGDITRECTVGTVVLQPWAGRMFVKQGGSQHIHAFPMEMERAAAPDID